MAALSDAIDRRLLTQDVNMVVLTTDGGGDHNTTYLSVTLSAAAVFIVYNLDGLIHMRTCPLNSATHEVERVMATFNVGLSNGSLSRDPVDPVLVRD